ncbi:MAG: flagellar assembly protein J [Methanocella sp. PtaU1.Bin125]|nr:MAG: flagellar assembly protein J [Methanocella sp. PtaU1.Bin125]
MASELYLIDGLAYRLFGAYARRNRQVYFDLEVSLKKGNINVPLDIYVSRMLFISAMAGFSVAASFVMIALVAAMTSPDHTFLPWHDVSSDNPLVNVAASQPFALVLLAGASFLAAFMTSYLLYRNYPFYRASIRESNINQMLPHAVTFMYAMSNGGMNLLEIFRTMNEHSDIYGEVAVELETVIRGVDLMGLDLITSIKQASLLTASEPLRNFFDSLAANMESGGDLAKFMHSRSDQFQVVASQERRGLLEMLNMLAEVYVTAFVAGPLFLIVILISLGMITSGDTRQIELLIYLLIPGGSLLFIWLLTILGLGSDDNRAKEIRRELDEFADVRKVATDGGNKSKTLDRAEFRYNLSRFLESPAAAFIGKPSLVLYITVPVAIVVFIVLARPAPGLPYYEMLEALTLPVLAMLAIALLPFALFWEMRSHRVRKMDAVIPEFLKRLASYNESGLTLTLAIKSLLSSNLGVLNSEIRKMWTDIEWGAETKDALIRFERRINTASIRRVVTLITKASESSGDIKETLSIAAADAAATQNDRSDRVLNMLLYTSIIYISFFVFLYIIYTLSTVFLPAVPGHAFTDELQAAAQGISFAGGADVGVFQLLFMHAVLIQGLFSGLVTGMMSEGNIYSGLKHAAIMMFVGYVVFALFI